MYTLARDDQHHVGEVEVPQDGQEVVASPILPAVIRPLRQPSGSEKENGVQRGGKTNEAEGAGGGGGNCFFSGLRTGTVANLPPPTHKNLAVTDF